MAAHALTGALATIAVLIGFGGQASAQGGLTVVLTEDPFLCDTIVRPLGTVSGFVAGEPVEFSSPELNGVFSRRNADAAGQVAMRWNCDRPRTWTVTVAGLVSGTSTTFVVTGKAAPPPPDAPIGAAFDNRTAMTIGEMAIWKDFSPFSTAGIYIPVNSSWDNRADKIQSNLTPAWVDAVFADGWSLIPIYVGFQAPDRCQTARFEGHSLDPITAREQGLAAAADAVDSVSALGIGPGSPIYYDMEAYRPGCSEAVLSFLDAWTEGVHARGYLSGIYGSRSSTMWDLSQALGRANFDAPDAVWVSTGNGRQTAYGLEVPPDGQWANARMHQYRLSITRTYGGVTLEIDENIVDAPLARPGGQPPAAQPTAVQPGQANVDSDGDGVTEPSPDNCDNLANPDQADLDNDGDGDACDRDIDGDGVDNVRDFGPRDPTIGDQPPATTTSVPEPTPAPAIVDTDGDGIGEPEPDNCDGVANPDQADLDNDGDGDVCDGDIDGDGVSNEIDQEPRDQFIGAVPTPTAAPEPPPSPVPTSAPEPAPSPVPTAAPIPSPTPSVAASQGDGSDDEVEPQVIVLPTPATGPTTLPTAPPDAPDAAGADDNEERPTPEPGTSVETASETVTITVDETGSLMPYLLGLLGLFCLFCAGLGARSLAEKRSMHT